jgi:hypothetical protein
MSENRGLLAYIGSKTSGDTVDPEESLTWALIRPLMTIRSAQSSPRA